MPDIIAASRQATPAKSEALPIRRALHLSCLLLTILVLTLLAGCTVPPPSDPQDEALLQDFRSLAFQTERPVLGNDGRPRPRRDHLAKWTIPVRAALIDGDSEDLRAPVPPSFRRLAEAHLDDLAGLTGLEIAPAPASRANLLVFLAADPFAAARRHRGLFAHKITDRSSYEALLAEMERTATCFGFLWGGWPSGRSIDFAVAFIRADRGARTVEGCLVQEVTQVLGPMNDLAPTADSVFSDSGRQVALTARDRLLIRMLYDARLKPGMGWAEAEPLAREALAEFRRGG
ncbi:MAG TPA: DUF2927 domain-containing protein [Kiloniellaceae bacterium]|nr:DUF2927 domain-containing protein [Kiloniellaceae bacterium]